MNRSRSRVPIALIALLALAAPAMAQSRIAVPLLPGTPLFQGPIFSNADAVAAAGGGKIHYVTGLRDPATAVHHAMQPP